MVSISVKAYLESQNIGIQLVKPHNHRVNAAEREIKTYKNYLIAGLCSCDDNFLTILWRKLIKKCQDLLNMLITSGVHKKVSAYHVLQVSHDFNGITFPPPGIRSNISNPPETRSSCGPCALNVWYIIPAYNHY